MLEPATLGAGNPRALPATRSGETRSSLGTGPLPRAPRCPQAVGMWWPKGTVRLVSVNGD